MKKSLLIVTGLLFSLLANSQVLIVPRLEGAFYSSDDCNPCSVDLGISGLYSIVDLELNDQLSFSLSNLWLYSELGSLYKNTFHSDKGNWLQWANVTWSPGNFFFNLGKNYMMVGGYETDYYDYEQFYQLCSQMWNEQQVYQWGAGVGYTTSDEAHSFMLQATTSPYGERFFKSGLYSYIFCWTGEVGPLSTRWSAAVHGSEGECLPQFTFGNRLTFGDFYAGLDLLWLGDKSSFVLDLNREFDRFAISGKLGYDRYGSQGSAFGGVVFNLFPVKDNHNLKFQLMGGYNGHEEIGGPVASVGLTYVFEAL